MPCSSREGRWQQPEEAVTKVAQTAHMEFPGDDITISTLVPDTGLPWELIHNINRQIVSKCAALKRVNITHHPTLTLQHTFDHIHLDWNHESGQGRGDSELEYHLAVHASGTAYIHIRAGFKPATPGMMPTNAQQGANHSESKAISEK
ncbi:unnamed protein product [Pleuronectes platessa]|uniref:Uncharacterized protein n=1 Tax=Pleuronectes platessa TaxID=8262 RepID=A0A9N7YFT0_PLEPL|nr:unnamed protein product [Pleuronectes platessa]